MKTLNLKVIVALILATLIAGCGGSNSSDPTNSTGTTASVATSLRYYKSAGFVPPGQQSWYYDLTIDFTQANFKVTSKIYGSECVKTANMTYNQSLELNNLISDMELDRNSGPVVLDAAEEYMEFATATNPSAKIYLEDIGSPLNAVYATSGGPELAQFFQNLVVGMPTVCP